MIENHVVSPWNSLTAAAFGVALPGACDEKLPADLRTTQGNLVAEVRSTMLNICGNSMLQFSSVLNERPKAVSFSIDGHFFAAAGDAELALWGLPGTSPRYIKMELGPSPIAVAISVDGKLVAVAEGTGQSAGVGIWAESDGKWLGAAFPDIGTIRRMSFTTDSTGLTVVGEKAQATWSVKSIRHQ